MDRSFSNMSKKIPSKRYNTLSSTESRKEFRSIKKSRANHSRQPQSSTQPLDAPNQQAPLQEDSTPSGYQSMKDFVRAFKKNDSATPLDQEKNQALSKRDSCISNRSMRSQCSRYSSRPQSNRSGLPLLKKSSRLEELEKRVQKVLQQKLCFAAKKKQVAGFLSLTHQDEFSKDIKDLVDEIRNFREDNESQDNLDVDDINRKIELLEKIMAESFSESQMLKKYYYNKNSIRKSLVPRSLKTQLSKSEELLKTMPISTEFKTIPSLYSQSNNQHSYKKPSKKAYEKVNLRQDKYSLNRQPVPRSSYTRDYLFYGNLPRYIYKNKDIPVITKVKTGNRPTEYESEFKEKKSVITNPKQLDCTHDKIKRRLKVSFITNKNKAICQHSHKKVNQKTLQSIIKHKQNKILNPCTKSEFHREYKGKKLSIENPIKNKNLQNLKYQYKASLHA